MRTYTLTTDQLREFAERVHIAGFKRRLTVIENGGNPDDLLNTEPYLHIRCQDVEDQLCWLWRVQ